MGGKDDGKLGRNVGGKGGREIKGKIGGRMGRVTWEGIIIGERRK